MRIATIGQDGGLYDGDGRRYSGPRPLKFNPENTGQEIFPPEKRVRRIRKGTVRKRGRSYMGQAPDKAPSETPYTIAARLAVPMTGLEFTRQLGNAATQVYPGRFVVSPSRYPGFLFRVALEPPTANNPQLVKLAIISGEGQGGYLEVFIRPDVSGEPSLFGDFLIVPNKDYWKVEYSFLPPVAVIDGQPEPRRVTAQYIVGTLDNASFQLMRLPNAITPVEVSKVYTESALKALAALMLVMDGIRKIGPAYDFARIGEAEVKILVRISTDIFSRALTIYNRLRPGPLTILGTTSQAAIFEYQKLIDDISIVRPYWSAMFTRVLFYQTLSEIGNAMLTVTAAEETRHFIDTQRAILNDHPDALKFFMSQKENGQPIGQERAEQLIQGLKQISKRSRQDLDRRWLDFKIAYENNPDYREVPLEDVPLSYTLQYGMLTANAQDCRRVRRLIKMQMTGFQEECLAGLGQTETMPALIPPLLGMGISGRARRLEIAKNLDRGISQFKGKLIDERSGAALPWEQVAPKLIEESNKLLAGVTSLLQYEKFGTIPARALEALNFELHQKMSEATVKAAEGDPIALNAIRDALREKAGADVPLEAFGVEALDNMKKAVNRFQEDLISGPVNEIGEQVEHTIASERDRERGQERRKFAARNFSERMVSSTVRGFASERPTSILGIGLVDSPKSYKQKILSTLMEKFADSRIFGQVGMTELLDLIASDMQVTKADLREYVFKQSQKDKKMEDEKVSYEEVYDRVKDEFRFKETGDRIMDSEAKEAGRRYRRLERVYQLIDKMVAGERIGETEKNVQTMDERIEAERATERGAMAAQGDLTLAERQKGDVDATIVALDALVATIEGNVEIVDRQRSTIMKAGENPQKMITLRDAIQGLKGATAELASVIAKKAEVAAQTLKLQSVRDALDNANKAIEKAKDAELAVEQAFKELTAARVIGLIKKVNDKYLKAATNKDMLGLAGKNMVVGWIQGIIGYTIYLGILALPWQIIYFAFTKHWIPGPFYLMFGELLPRLIGMLPTANLRVGEAGVVNPEGAPTEPSGVSNILLLGIGISLIFFGRQLFPALQELFRVTGQGIKTFTQIIPTKKKAKKGRVKAGEEERVVIGRGAPVNVENARAKLLEARDLNDKKAEKKWADKLERARERGQSIPPGLIGLLKNGRL